MFYDEGATKDVLKNKLLGNNARYNVKLERNSIVNTSFFSFMSLYINNILFS
jgi:hypothetical protein